MKAVPLILFMGWQRYKKGTNSATDWISKIAIATSYRIEIQFWQMAWRNRVLNLALFLTKNSKNFIFFNRNSNESHFSSRLIRKKCWRIGFVGINIEKKWSFRRFSHKWRQIFDSISWRSFFKRELPWFRKFLSRFFEILSLVCPNDFKGSSDPSHFIFKINVGKS